MFADNQIVRLPVSLTLVDGHTLNGCLILPRAQKLLETMNKPEPFVEFEDREGVGAIVIAKSSIVSAALLDERKSRSGAEQLRKPVRFDAHQILGLDRNAPEAAIRPAYVEKAKLYHPDQFAAHPLPPEVSDYLASMFMKVQQAYEQLSGETARPAA